VKRLPILSKMFLLLFCFAIALSAFNSGSTVGDTLIIPYMTDEPLVDGVIDTGWSRYPEVGLFVYTDVPDSGASSLSGWYKVAWHDAALSMFVHIIDDTIITRDAESWERDCIEIFIDGHNDKAAAYDSNDVQWRATALGDNDTIGPQYSDSLTLCWNNGVNLIPPYYTLAWTENADGYDMELSIPDTGLVKQLDATDPTILSPQIFDLAPGTVIGWELHVSDDDSLGGGNDAGLRWWSDGEPYSNPSHMGTAVLGGFMEWSVLMIPKKGAPITVDGLDLEWADSFPEIAMSVGGRYSDGGQPDFGAWYRAAWSDAGDLYFFGRTMDDSIYAGAVDWASDNWEIYLDGNNNKDATGYENDDVQLRFLYGVSDSATQGPGPSDCEIYWQETADGYDLELSVSASYLIDTNITLTEGKIIGWEVQCSDNDNAGGDDSGREAIAKWFNASNESHLDPSLFGEAIMSNNVPTKVPEAPSAALIVPAVITSNSIAASVNVSGTLSICNLAGQVLKTVAADGDVSIDVSDLASGVYLVSLNATEPVTKKVILLK
jgi:hypothetical protein